MSSVAFFGTIRRLAVVLLCAPLALALVASTASAQGRVALVVGIDRYTQLPAYAQLTKAVADARAVRDLLRGPLKFDHVVYSENPTLGEARNLLGDFARRLQKGDIAFVFYAGHGANIRLANYLLPSDLPPMREVTTETHVRLEEESMIERAISEERIREMITLAGARAAIIVIDACRNNVVREMVTAASPRSRNLVATSQVQGARPVDRPRVQGQTQFLSLYSASPGQSALDSLGQKDQHPNSPFTRVLVERLPTPNQRVYEIMRGLRAEVARLAATVGHDQIPAITDEALEEVVLVGQGDPAVVASDANVRPVAAAPKALVTAPLAPSVALRPAVTAPEPPRPPDSTSSGAVGGEAWSGWRLAAKSNALISVGAVAHTQDWRLGAGSYRDGGVRLWSLTDGRLTGEIRPGEMPSELAFNPSGQLIAANGSGGIQIWSTSTLQRIHAFPAGPDRINALAFSEDGSAIVARSGRGAIRAFDLSERRERIATPADAALLSPNARRIDRKNGWYISSSGGGLRVTRGRRGSESMQLLALAGGGWLAVAEDGLTHTGTPNATSVFELVRQRDRLPVTPEFVAAYRRADGLR